jgi:pimeloyl-ACP methyl ester carboxylesterase
VTERAEVRFLDLEHGRLESLDLPATRPGRPDLLLLHEGLGSVSTWRDFPERLAEATGSRVVAYSRAGFGRSAPRARAYSPRFMHEEAHETLPALRAHLGMDRVVLVGHSTGASMALLHAAAPDACVAGVLAMAPLLFVEPANLESIRRARTRYEASDWRERLARHHDDADAVFRGWSETWLDPGFASWNIAPQMGAIRAPVVAILGREDEYSSLAQLECLRASAAGAARVELLVLDKCGHAPHRDQPRAVLAAVKALLDAV